MVREERATYQPGAVGIFAAIHAVALGVFFVPFRRGLLWRLLVTYAIRMFG
jgi:hypothetical protein